MEEAGCVQSPFESKLLTQVIILNFYQVQEPVYRWLWLEGKDEPELVLPLPEVDIQLE